MKSLLLSSLLLCTLYSLAQPGILDKSYGTDNTGTVSASDGFAAYTSATQPDDNLLLGGQSLLNDNYLNYVVKRFTKDGLPDSSFGADGQTVTTYGDLVKNIREVGGWKSIAVHPDGTIVATGIIVWYNPDLQGDFLKLDNDIVVARFLPDGAPDKSFGDNGRIVTNLGHLEKPSAVAVQADGKIIVAGSQTTDSYGNGLTLLLLRYNVDGSLDRGFGNGNGYVNYSNADPHALLTQPDGKIVTGGSLTNANSFLVLRYLPDGAPDETFGNNGVVTTFFTANTAAQINSLAIDEKQRIVAAGVTGNDGDNEVVRYLPDGSLDNSFDKDGKVKLTFTDFEYANTNTVLTQPGNKIVISSALNGKQTEFLPTPALTGLNEDGSLDSAFGTSNGQTVINSIFSNEASANAVMQKDGKILISRSNYDDLTSVSTYMITRFNGYPTQVPLLVRVKRYLHNHGISWKGLPAEDKIAYYSVEQSANRSTGFLPLAKVSGVANLRDYNITNTHLLEGMNYYRIKAVSTDGTVRYSEVAAGDNPATMASVFPNPARSNLTVQGLKTNETASIAIKDATGTVLQKGVSSGSAQYNTGVGNLKPGTYYLNITTKEKTEVLPFVKE